MTIDLNRRGDLTPSEKLEIATLMHYSLLDEIFRVSEWSVGDAVFHGGTSLKVVWQSPRFSEDLDFMIAQEHMADLDRIMRTARDGIKGRLLPDMPGAEFAIKGQVDPESRLARYAVRWTHPQRRGKVLVKLEFYEVPADKLSRYAALKAKPSPDQETRIAIGTSIVGPELLGVMGDKLVAVAKRPYVKYRDIFDLHYVRKALAEQKIHVDDDVLTNAVEKTADIYGYDLIDIAQCLTNSSKSAELSDLHAFEADMEMWLPGAAHDRFKAGGAYEVMLAEGRQSCNEAAEAIEARNSLRLGE